MLPKFEDPSYPFEGWHASLTFSNVYSSSAAKRWITLVSLVAVSLLFGWSPLLGSISLAIQNDEYTHILLILPIALSLIVFERKLTRKKDDWGLGVSLPFLGLAIVLAACAHEMRGRMPEDVHLAAQMLALVLFWIGTFVLCCGMAAARQVAFPLLLLFAIIPLPRIALDPIIGLLQVGSAWSAHVLFAAVGVPSQQDRILINIPGLTMQVAQECSSIRSSSMLLVTAVALAQIFLNSFWTKSFIALFAIPLSIAKNGLRIFTIAMLGTRVDPAYLHGRLHRQGGILFFIFALACLFAAIRICKRAEGTTPTGLPVRQLLPDANESTIGRS